MYQFHQIMVAIFWKIKMFNDRDRTICDIIKNRDKVDPEIFSEAMKQYIRSKEKNITNLFVYAKKLNIEDIVRKYVEVMLW